MQVADRYTGDDRVHTRVVELGGVEARVGVLERLVCELSTRVAAAEAVLSDVRSEVERLRRELAVRR